MSHLSGLLKHSIGLGAVTRLRSSAWPGAGWASSGTSEQSDPDVSCAPRGEPGDSHDVVGGDDQVGVHLHPLASAITGAAQTAHRFHPAKRLVYPLADPLTDAVALMPHRAHVERTASPPRLVPRHMRGDSKRAAVGHKLAGGVAL